LNDVSAAVEEFFRAERAGSSFQMCSVFLFFLDPIVEPVSEKIENSLFVRVSATSV
jgi:hypothetical protein